MILLIGGEGLMHRSNKSWWQSQQNVSHALHQVKNSNFRSKARFQKFISFCHLTMAVTSDIASPKKFFFSKKVVWHVRRNEQCQLLFKNNQPKKFVFANYISFKSALISLVHPYVVNQTDAFIKQPSLWISCKNLQWIKLVIAKNKP